MAGTEQGSAALGLAAAQQGLDAQPFSRLVQARITGFGDGAATLEIDIREELLQQHGFVHGGGGSQDLSG